MTTTDTIKNFDPREAHAYAVKMKELVDFMFAEIYSCRNYGSFHFNKKMGSIQYKNNEPERENQIFTVQRVSSGVRSGQNSHISHKPFLFKIEYFENGTEECQEVSTYLVEPDHTSREYHQYFSTEQLEDDGFLFQQSLILGEQELFGICCTSWLYHMKVQCTYIICEFDMNEMNRVHKVVFDDVRSRSNTSC